MSDSTVPQVKMVLEDPSEFRPEHTKDIADFRDFRIHTVPERVINVYKAMHKNQTFAFAKGKLDDWGKLNHTEMTLIEALDALNNFVDECDPDVDVPNAVHAFQTAEGIRKAHPDNEWFQVTGLIHDLGKIMALYGEPQWCVVGDTFPVGCAPAKSIVFDAQFFEEKHMPSHCIKLNWETAVQRKSVSLSNPKNAFEILPFKRLEYWLCLQEGDIEQNPDMKDEKFNTRQGIYEENCGLENVVMSWGHDEYLYQVLKGNECHLPEEALYMIRFHSFYPWHTSGDYMHLCNNKDVEMMHWIREFNKFDLYTKCPDIPDVKELIPYYTKLIEKYVPGKLKW